MTPLSPGEAPLLATTDELARFCAGLKGAPYVTIDTEFVRERTYYPVLCLVQVGGHAEDAGAGEVAAIDPMAPGISLDPLVELLLDPKITKVVHAARQDLEIFLKLCGEMPRPIVDTQILAMVCGFGDSASYETLAGKLAHTRVDKLSRFTDWARRPLTQRQVEYALSDVTHLRIVYEKLWSRATEAGRLGWIEDEIATLTDRATYEVPPEDAWRRLKLRSDKPRVLAVAREIAAWREREAQLRDVPRGRVLGDENIIEIAAHPPRDAAHLAQCRGLSRGFAEGRVGEAILRAVAHALDMPEAECPRVTPRPEIPGGLGPIIELLRVLLKLRCDDHEVAQRLVANSSDLERIAADDEADVPALKGWRREVFGAEALALKQGKLAMTASGRSVKVIRIGE